jgi:hypothetical protein
MTDVEKIRAEIQVLEDRRYEAMLTGDFDAFAGLCHSDLLYTHSNGGTDSLESYLAKVRAGYYLYHSIDHPVETIVVCGDTAVVLGEMNASITAGGVQGQIHNKALAVWVCDEGDWKLLGYQPTPLK